MRGTPVRGTPAVWALALALLLGGCVARHSLGEQCELSTGCAAPLVCRLARCRRACGTDRDCPLESRCVLDDARLGSCLLPDEASCALDGDCPEPLVCVDRSCVNACAGPRDCPPGGLCIDSSCRSTAGRDCRGDRECAVPERCIAGRCRDQCAADRDCREGARCADGACELLEAPSDGGMDADTPAPDAGPDAAIEAGMDAGADAGALDAGADAGAIDAGVDAAPPSCADGGTCAPVHQAVVGCAGQTCAITSCVGAFLDCDGRYANGCEVQPASDHRHCGGCDAPCGPGEACFDGGCEAALVEQVVYETNSRCVRWSNGRLSCWGSNGFGQVGVGTLESPITMPVHVPGVTDARAVCAGSNFMCAALGDGSARCWGRNDDGQLGNGAALDGGPERSPVTVLAISDAVDVICGNRHACALRGSGQVECWGDDFEGALGSSLVGTNGRSSTPVLVDGIADAVEISGRFRTTCVRGASGEVRCWGRGANGQLGDGMEGSGPTHTAASPVLVQGLSAHVVRAIHQNAGSGFALTESGAVLCWGEQSNFGCALSRIAPTVLTPEVVPALQGARAVHRTCAIDDAGAHVCWGRNPDGRLGLGTFDTPIDEVTASGAVGVEGLGLSCVIASGQVRCAGHNGNHELADTTTRDRPTLGPVGGLP